MRNRLDRLSAEDAQILRLEEGPIAGHTLKVVVAAAPSGGPEEVVERLRRRVEAGLDEMPRLRQRLSPTPLGLAPPVWTDDPAFDVRRHVRAVPGSNEDGAHELGRLVAESMAERLDRDRPLWSIEVAGPLADGSVAYLLKTHHCMADGTGTLRVAAALLWDVEVEPAPRAGGAASPVPAPGRGGLLAAGLIDRTGAAAAEVRSVLGMLRSPRRWPAAAGQLARMPGAAARELRPLRGSSALDVRVGPARTVAFVRRPLEELKRVEHALEGHTTVNDVLLAAVAGALRTWLIHRHDELPPMRVKVPVSMHDREEGPAALGNRDSFFCVDLPVAEADPRRRLELVREETAERKRDHDAETLYALFDDLAHLPRPILHRAEALAERPGVYSLCVSNVPGPRDRRYVLGGEVLELHSLAEVGERHGLRVSAISYHGEVSIGLCADAGAVGDIEVLAAALEGSFDDLQAAMA